MKSFFKLFYDSFRSLKDLRTLTTAGILLAMAVAIRTLSIEVTPDLRISFTFIPIAAIGMLYGPVVCGASSVLLDLLGYIITNKTARAYSPQLAVVVLLSGIIYGCYLYNCKFKLKDLSKGLKDSIAEFFIRSGIGRIFGACFTVALVCNVMLNSYFLYSLYVNKNFSLFNGDDWPAFLTYVSPRALKNLIELFIRTAVLSAILPLIKMAYDKVRAQYGHKSAKNA